MCFFSAPKIPTPPQPAQFQPMQAPKDLTQGKAIRDALRRRGFMASIMNVGGAQGITSAPTVTGTGGGMTGG